MIARALAIAARLSSIVRPAESYGAESAGLRYCSSELRERESAHASRDDWQFDSEHFTEASVEHGRRLSKAWCDFGRM